MFFALIYYHCSLYDNSYTFVVKTKSQWVQEIFVAKRKVEDLLWNANTIIILYKFIDINSDEIRSYYTYSFYWFNGGHDITVWNRQKFSPYAFVYVHSIRSNQYSMENYLKILFTPFYYEKKFRITLPKLLLRFSHNKRFSFNVSVFSKFLHHFKRWKIAVGLKMKRMISSIT